MRVQIICLLAAVGFLLGTNQPTFSDSLQSATVAEHHGNWEMAYGVVYYRVFGDVKNTSDQPLKYIEVEVELIDKDGKVVLSRSGYNQKAEVLGMQDIPGTLEEKLKEVEPIKPGDKDFFRLAVDKTEIPANPKFTSYNVKITEAR